MTFGPIKFGPPLSEAVFVILWCGCTKAMPHSRVSIILIDITSLYLSLQCFCSTVSLKSPGKCQYFISIFIK